MFTRLRADYPGLVRIRGRRLRWKRLLLYTGAALAATFALIQVVPYGRDHRTRRCSRSLRGTRPRRGPSRWARASTATATRRNGPGTPRRAGVLARDDVDRAARSSLLGMEPAAGRRRLRARRGRAGRLRCRRSTTPDGESPRREAFGEREGGLRPRPRGVARHRPRSGRRLGHRRVTRPEAASSLDDERGTLMIAACPRPRGTAICASIGRPRPLRPAVQAQGNFNADWDPGAQIQTLDRC